MKRHQMTGRKSAIAVKKGMNGKGVMKPGELLLVLHQQRETSANSHDYLFFGAVIFSPFKFCTLWLNKKASLSWKEPLGTSRS
jgi:hypothetical protein